jgi:hypothetical protein
METLMDVEVVLLDIGTCSRDSELLVNSIAYGETLEEVIQTITWMGANICDIQRELFVQSPSSKMFS